MRILHICITGPYTEGMGYQEDRLAEIHHTDGNEVLVIANKETYDESGNISCTNAGITKSKIGYKICRLNYMKHLPLFFSKKIRRYPGILREIEKFDPNVILFHGTCGYDIINVSKYKRLHPEIKLYVDCHEAYYNSAQSFASKYILHKALYKSWFCKSLPNIDKVFYIGEGEKEYLADMMKLKANQMEFYPLGGSVITIEEKRKVRYQVRKDLLLSDDQTLFLHSGKLDKLKRTSELINAFSSILDDRLRLVIIGSIPNDQEDILLSLIDKDPRIIYLGWKPADLLSNYLAASDLYLQPGSVSATLQNAICSGTPVMIYPHKCYDVYVRENGFRVVSEEDMRSVFERVSLDSSCLNEMSKASFKYACEFLDYKKLAARLYQ